MSRMEAYDLKDQPELKAIFDSAQQLMGFTPNDALIMAHQPGVLKAFAGLVQQIYAPGAVPQGLKRLMGLIASRASGCRYCQAHATHAAIRNQEEEARIQAVWEFEESPLFNAGERAALRVALKSAMVPNAVSDQDFEALKQHYSNAQIVELLSVIGMYGFLNRWNATLNTTLEAAPASVFQEIQAKAKPIKP